VTAVREPPGPPKTITVPPGDCPMSGSIIYMWAVPGSWGEGSVLSCRVVCNEPENGVWPSDHFGVYTELSVS
jgi:hypothetical protein